MTIGTLTPKALSTTPEPRAPGSGLVAVLLQKGVAWGLKLWFGLCC